VSGSLRVFGVVVSDMGKSLGFYRQLGLAIPPEADQQPHVEVALDGGFRLLFDTVDVVRSFDPDWTAPERGSRTAIGFEYGSAAEVDQAYQDLTAAGYYGHKDPWDAVWRQRYAILHDPDGNAVELFAAI
jgi:uncharacterized glyoxalase superfamily protein PhnB